MQLPEIHKEFILTPIEKEIDAAIKAFSGLGEGIETYPLRDYMLQSLFLKMTGAQEQKLKCICWTVATVDFDLRFKILSQKVDIEACSTAGSKGKIYKALLESIQKYEKRCGINNIIKIRTILNDVVSTLSAYMDKSLFKSWGLVDEEKKNYLNTIVNKNDFIVNEETLIKNKSRLLEEYETLYRHRNRCAHNTLSDQDNLPSLQILATGKNTFDNYFVWFAILMLLDRVFIQLYCKFEEVFVKAYLI